jgi:hypothetical protein
LSTVVNIFGCGLYFIQTLHHSSTIPFPVSRHTTSHNSNKTGIHDASAKHPSTTYTLNTWALEELGTPKTSNSQINTTFSYYKSQFINLIVYLCAVKSTT